jgi:superfamily II DNA or RNA helicase
VSEAQALIQELFAAIRSAASSAAWSRGVELARAEAVSAEAAAEDEIVLRIATRGGLLSPAVTLFPEDGDWDCDCGARVNACEHVAAAIIALRRARSAGLALPAPQRAPGRIGYRFTREGGGLALERVVVSGGREEPLTATLAAVASGRVDGPEFLATQADLAAEQVLGAKRRGRLPRGVLVALLGKLAACADVRLDGQPIRTSAARVGWVAVLEDEEPGFRLRALREAPGAEHFDDALALCGETLQALGATPLTGRELEDLSGDGLYFEPDRVSELVSEILPALERRMRVELRTQRLPRAIRETPRLALDVSREDDALAVLPTLVYGDPPVARVDAGRLVPLGGGPVPLRDEEAERTLLRRLQGRLELLPGRRVRLVGEEAVRLAELLRRWDGPLRGDAHRDFFRAPPLTPHFAASEADFELAFHTQVEGARRQADAGRVLRAWRSGNALVALEGGGFAPLPADWLERFGERLADLLAAREAAGTLPRCMLFELAKLCQEHEQPPPPSFGRLLAQLGEADVLPAAQLPEDLRGTLRGYQRRGVDWLCALREAGLGALLADDMGLGKTLQALCALHGRTLVVTPTSVLHNWAQEIERFRPSLRAAFYHGPGRSLDAEADVTLTTYAILRLDADRLGAESWDTVILDEAQKIKNADSQVARAAHRLRARFPVALTGTPVENRLDELWSQLHFTNRGLLGGRRNFEERFSRPIAAGDPEAIARLRTRIRPFVLRRLKREVAPELPPRTEVVLHAVLEEDERRVYDAIRAATRDEVVRRLEVGGSLLAALEALLRLRQAACHPALVPGQRAATSSKLTLLLEVLEEAVAEGHKALVFSQWTSLLDLVEPQLAGARLRFGRLDGATRDRAAVVAAFQNAAGPPLLLVSLTAGGVGLNLTAADHVFILDPWWNPAVEDQAADRTHRIGQERPVMVYRLVARDTVEERILALQSKKRELSEAALGAAGGAAAITREDLLALLA